MSLVIAFCNMLYTRRELIGQLVHRELGDRYRGQVLGRLWAFAHPLLLMFIYTLLFAYVFPARYGAGTHIQDYAPCVLAGIVPWLAFQDVLSRSSSVLVGHANLVTQIVFPTEVLPVKTVFAGALPYLVAVVFTIFYSAMHGSFSWMVLTIPWLIFCQLVAMLGVAFLLSVIGIFLRDIRDVVQVFCTINLFAQPILYNPHSIPKFLLAFFYINPFSYVIWCWQDALYFGKIVHPAAWIVFPLISLAVFLLGWKVFKQAQHTFGDAL